MEVRQITSDTIKQTVKKFETNNIETSQGYTYKQNAQEIFENFFGTNNPFAAFGFESMPFASRLNKPGPAKAKPVTMDLECTLKGKLYFCS